MFGCSWATTAHDVSTPGARSLQIRPTDERAAMTTTSCEMAAIDLTTPVPPSRPQSVRTRRPTICAGVSLAERCRLPPSGVAFNRAGLKFYCLASGHKGRPLGSLSPAFLTSGEQRNAVKRCTIHEHVNRTTWQFIYNSILDQ